MEVHAHTHTARKKWTHYLWEFLMLFLAVFCGFLAENQREHMIEHQREKKYITTLKEDLAADTVNLNTSLSFWEKTSSLISSTRPFAKPPVKDSNINKIYQLAIGLINSDEFIYNDRTIEQLRNSGSYRLIRKQGISETLIRYDSYIRNTLRSQEKISKEFVASLMHLQNELFDSELIETKLMSKPKTEPKANKSYQHRFMLPQNDQVLFKYYNELFTYYAICIYLIYTERDLKQQAIHILELINKEYHLK